MKVSESTTLIATTPAGMAVAQDAMIVWAKGMNSDVTAEIQELRAELVIAKRNHWKTGPIMRRLRREGKRLHFYVKVRKALEAGFYVVPNFMGDMFAIRTDAKRASGGHQISMYERTPTFPQKVKMLPAGEGRYVAPNASHYHEEFNTVDGEGKDIVKHRYDPAELEAVEFPFQLMKPAVMDATGEAMAAGIFDSILMARDYASCGDPMVLGRILNPRTSRPDVTFFIAWVMPLDRI